jgi:transposase InsO family protein
MGLNKSGPSATKTFGEYKTLKEVEMTHKDSIENQRKSLLIYAQRCGNIAKACHVFGVSRTTFYKLKRQYRTHGHVRPIERKRPKMPNEYRISVVKELLKLAQKEPHLGCWRYAAKLKEMGIKISSRTVQKKLNKLGLSHMWKRYAYVERLNLKKGGLLTEKSLKEMQEKKRQSIQADWPGDLVGLDTYYVGNIKGIGKIYQQTGIDCYSRYGFAKLYTRTTHREVLDFIESELMPIFWRDCVTLDNILTDNGTEYKNREVKSCLREYGIGYRNTRVKRPESNGICERFQRTIKEEFYMRKFIEKRYYSIEEIQEDLDEYIQYYNGRRRHSSLDKGSGVPVDYFKLSRKLKVVA